MVTIELQFSGAVDNGERERVWEEGGGREGGGGWGKRG